MSSSEIAESPASRSVADYREGALYWPEKALPRRSHLEKVRATPRAVRALRHGGAGEDAAPIPLPRAVVALGDSFHDGDGPARIAAADRAALAALQRGREWIWITGNHDPDPADGIGGSFAGMLAIGALLLRHEPTGAAGEIAGHLHPVARVVGRGRAVSRRCFASDGARLVMPAFGAYAGGLNVRDRAFADVFGTLAFTAHVLGERRLYTFAASRCLPD